MITTLSGFGSYLGPDIRGGFVLAMEEDDATHVEATRCSPPTGSVATKTRQAAAPPTQATTFISMTRCGCGSW